MIKENQTIYVPIVPTPMILKYSAVWTRCAVAQAYTDTTRPNHLAQEVMDNSVDEALAGHARSVTVILHQDPAPWR